jgi:hypothetical protein
MRVKATVERVASVGGNRYDAPRGILVEEHTSRLDRSRARGNLYILVEVSGHPAEREIIAEQLAVIVRDSYYKQRGSVTAGLQQALREANRLLYEENRNSLATDRCTAGMSCAVLRDADLFLAQAGPTAAFLGQEDRVTRFPEVSPWLDGVAPEDMDTAPLGERREVNVDLFHEQVSEGNTILLLESALASSLPPGAWPGILSRSPALLVLDELLAVSKGQDMSALVISLDAGEDQDMPQPTVQSVPEPKPMAPPLGKQVSTWMSHLRVDEHLRSGGRMLGAAIAGLGAAILTLLRRLVPGEPLPREGSGTSTARGKPAESGRGQHARRRQTSTPPSERVQRLLIGVAIAIPVIVTVVVLVVVLQRGQSKQAEIEAAWQEASGYWEQAKVTADPAVVRDLLTKAQVSVDTLLELQPGHAGALELHGNIQGRLDLINGVQRVRWISNLKTYAAAAELSRLVVKGIHVFVLDRHSNKIYHHRLDESQKALLPDSSEPVLLGKGAQIDDTIVGDLIDMVWMPTGPGRQNEGLVVLESGGSLIEYDPATEGLRSLQVSSADTWTFAELVGSYYGRFYVLDSAANKILRYAPTADGYSEPPDEWLTAEVDLLDVVDMAIGDSIYLVYADGKLRKLTGGEPDAFDISGWDTPPSGPSAIYTRPPEETRAVYVADTGNSRIVECTKEGRFERQFRLSDTEVSGGSDPLANVTSLFVDESIGQAYFLSEQSLYLIILPD